MPAGIQHGGVGLKKGVYAVVESSVKEEDEAELAKSDLFIPYYKPVSYTHLTLPTKA